MACEICGADSPAPASPPQGGGAVRPCPRCTYPAVSAEVARTLWEAGQLVSSGLADQAIRKLQQALRLAPESYIPRLRLAEAFERKAQGGMMGLLRLADREFNEALRLAPHARAVHVARLSLAAKLGRLDALKAEYQLRKDELPFAEECLRMISALEQTTGLQGAALSPAYAQAARNKAKYCFLGAAGAGVVGLVQLGTVCYRSVQGEYIQMVSMDFILCVGFLTAAGALGLEGYRARKEGRG